MDAIVSRDYRSAPDCCTRALALLLKKKADTSREEVAVTSTNGDDDQPEGEAKNGSKPRP